MLGFDVAPTAVAMARQKAAERGLDADFAEADALRLAELGRTFDTVLDCGAVQRLAAAGAFTGEVLDAGCGTGENTLLIASLGLPVLGFDVAPTAVRMARQKAAERGISADFIEADALRLEELGRTFDTVLDSPCCTRSTAPSAGPTWPAWPR